MVAVLYCLILVPVIIYLFFSVLEIWLTLRITQKPAGRNLIFVQASTEVTHTLLVFAYAQFMITFSGLLVHIGGALWWPIALLTVSILLRGSLYLVIFYTSRKLRVLYGLLLTTYLLGVISLLWALAIIVPAIIERQFVPDTANMELVLWLGMPILAISLIPIVAVYRFALKQINRHP
ncbi:hypothetical protein IPM09_01385 [Candidatus Saccharibacteria bacterium]|nr:MAG: hypothetical protein IPM09_01385 [Candidatus Saccharibacteria bacterium]